LSGTIITDAGGIASAAAFGQPLAIVLIAPIGLATGEAFGLTSIFIPMQDVYTIIAVVTPIALMATVESLGLAATVEPVPGLTATVAQVSMDCVTWHATVMETGSVFADVVNVGGLVAVVEPLPMLCDEYATVVTPVGVYAEVTAR
jgi:hypothetical protein